MKSILNWNEYLKRNIINETTKKGTQHIIEYEDSENYVIKKKIIGSFDIQDKKSWFYIFQRNPKIFPIIYDINSKYIKLEKLNTEIAEIEIEKMKNFLFLYGDSYIKNTINNQFAATTSIIFDMVRNNNLNYLNYILKIYGSNDKELISIFKKWILFFKKLIKVDGNELFEIHDQNFGYSNNILKILDI